VVIGTVALLAVPGGDSWPATLMRTPIGSLVAPLWGDVSTPGRVELPAPRASKVTGSEPVRRVPLRESSAPRFRATGTAAAVPNAAPAATPPTARAARTSRVVAAVARPARAPEVASRGETIEPLPALPLVPTASAFAPPLAAPAATGTVPPASALEATKVDVRPGIVKRVDARSSQVVSGSQEMVVLRVLVSAGGSPATVEVIRGSKTDPASNGAAVAAVRQWAFSPALKDGRPVDCWFNVAVPVEGTAQ